MCFIIVGWIELIGIEDFGMNYIGKLGRRLF